ncbi:hypothetical protein CMI47_04865 [Candidatus Pacearchaeota archaeon]|nr:hypothetical protein [Candidatus Pacearchaeota archaeon]|tara:strand:+ start:3024 stop:3269 length:246 start_codon:yes stop_codon:yes gene_type:complete
MIVSQELSYDVVLEARKEDVDYYFSLLKRKGWFDFVLPEWREEGVRIDRELNYPKTIQVDSIKCENTLNILGQLKGFEKWN